MNAALALDLIDTARWLLAQDLTASTSGNVSARLDGASMLITPSSLEYDLMQLDDLCVCDFQAQPIRAPRPPSSEAKMHAAVYRARPDVGAVIHFHPVYASAYAFARRPIPVASRVLEVRNGGDVPVVPCAASGSWELADAVAAALAQRNAGLLANHGAIVCGPDLNTARALAALVERTARICLLSEHLGGPIDVSGQAGAE